MTQPVTPPVTQPVPARRLTVHLGEDDTWHHRPRYAEIVHRAHQAGMAGASVFRGVEGFGRAGRVHTSRLLSLSEDLPVVVVIVDTADRIERLLPALEELVADALVVAEDVEVLGGVDRLRRGGA